MENSEKIDWPKIDEIVEKYNGNREARDLQRTFICSHWF